MGKTLLGHPEALSSLGWSSPTPSASLYRTNAPAPDHPRASLLNSLQLIDILPVLGDSKQKAVTRCALMTAE